MSRGTKEMRRTGGAGVSLVELQVALVVSAVLILGVYAGTVLPMVSVTQQSLLDGKVTGDVDASMAFLANLVTAGMGSGSRLFIIYGSSGSAVADGTAGVKLYVPYSNSTQDVNIYVQNGALIATQGSQTTTIVPAGVTSVSFKAVMAGSPAARTGAIACSLSILNRGNTYVYSTTVLPRNS